MFTAADIIAKQKQEGISAKELAEKLNVRIENLYKWRKGKRPQDPEDYKKVERWLNGEIESVPLEKPSGPIPENKKPDRIEQLLEMMIGLTKTQNTLLERQTKNIEEKVLVIDSNLADALGIVESLKLDLSSGREVVLRSLARLEKRKDQEDLLKEADNRAVELRAQLSGFDSHSGKDSLNSSSPT